MHFSLLNCVRLTYGAERRGTELGISDMVFILYLYVCLCEFLCMCVYVQVRRCVFICSRLYVGQVKVHTHGKVFICRSSQMHTHDKACLGHVVLWCS